MLKFSVIGISETWLDDSSHSSDIPGFNFIHNHRVGRTGGAVGLYLADYLEFKHRADLVFAKIVLSLCLLKSIEQREKT